jgi:hypothetical protein
MNHIHIHPKLTLLESYEQRARVYFPNLDLELRQIVPLAAESLLSPLLVHAHILNIKFPKS